MFRRVGITFAVYGDKDETGSGTERLIPFDVIPRIIGDAEWKQLEAGLRQRVQALNLFLHDVYHDQNIIRAGRIPADQVFKNSQYRPEMHGVDVASGIYSHIAGIDLVRAANAAGEGVGPPPAPRVPRPGAPTACRSSARRRRTRARGPVRTRG